MSAQLGWAVEAAGRMIDRKVDGMIGRKIDGMIDRMIDGMIDRKTDGMIDIQSEAPDEQRGDSLRRLM